jgi:thiosulfate/3-mercaptopyruvate sulfurtransferase
VHLLDAVNAPFEQWRGNTSQGLHGMLPPMPQLEGMLGRLGVTPKDRVIIVTTGLGAGDMAAAARVFWTLKVLGHRQAAILDGGLNALAADERGARRLTNVPASRPVTRYQARPDFSLLADAAATRAAAERGELLVDARSAAEFLGIHVGDAGERPGTLPEARNLPFDWLTENGSGRMLPLARLRSLLAAVGVDPAVPQVHFCHSGNRAALTWFAAYALLGNKQARLYDASMLEWATRDDLPMERRVQF